MKKGMPAVKVVPDGVRIAGGMDAVISPIFAKPGTARLAYNYEWGVNGGLDRLRGIEPFDGHPRPSDADYVYCQCTVDITGIVVGDTVTGATSAATGKVIYISGAYIAMTRVTGTFVVEGLQVAAVTQATVLSLTPTVDGFLDNTLSKAAADEYQVDITRIPGAGQVRGLQILNDVVYGWRNNVGQTEMAIYKSTAAGWVLVPMFHQISFTLGTTVYAEGSTLSQGGVTATVKRVVLESGTWGSNAAGRLIITTPAGGVFAAGAAAGGGAVTLSGASALIVLAPSGRVRAQVYTFTSSLATRRLYGCDGVNTEFEFDGTVYVPLNTGMGSIRATSVACHKNQVFFGFRTSVQNSGPGTPYVWSAVLGASEIGIGDTITNLISVGGATDASALMITGENSLHVLYGSSTLDFNLVPLSHVSGARADTVQDIGGVVALDAPGVMRYPASQNFGNFAWDSVSMEIQPLVANQAGSCSCYVSGLFKYRLFFADGTAISGLPVSKGKFWWSVIGYDRTILFAINEEIAGIARTFYGDEDGWVYEADVGRSFAGEAIEYALRLHPLSQRSPMVEKTYRQMQMEVAASSAVTLYTYGEFDDSTDGPTEQTSTPNYGSGLTWDLSNYDQSYWDVASTSRKTVPLEGEGTSVAITIQGNSDTELSHTLHAVTVLYTPRKITR